MFTPNDAQKKAIEHHTGPAFLIGGPGTGKTEVLARRVAHLTTVKGVAFGQLLVLTLNERTADSFRTQLVEAMGDDAAAGARVAIRTRREFFGRLLRQHAHLGIAGPEDQLLALLRVFGHVGIRQLWEEYRENREVAGQAAHFRDFRENILAVMETLSRTGHIARIGKSTDDELRALLDELGHAHGRYVAQLGQMRLIDYPTALRRLAEVFIGSPTEVAYIRRRAPWLLVDEYQDALRLEHELIRIIHGNGGNIMVAGDDDQRALVRDGGDPSCLTAFAKDFPGATPFLLEASWRGSRQLVPSLARLIRGNEGFRFKKNLKPAAPVDGDIPYFLVPDSAESAARAVATLFRELKDGGKIASYRQTGVVLADVEPFRDALRDAFRELDIPLRFDPGESPEAARALRAILALLAAISDTELPGSRSTQWKAIFEVALDRHGPVRKPAGAELRMLRERLRKSDGLLKYYHELLAEYRLAEDGRGEPLVRAAGVVSGLLAEFERDLSGAGAPAQRLRDFLEFAEFLEPVVDESAETNCAWAGTPERAKGMEFEAVAVFFKDPSGPALAPGLVEQAGAFFAGHKHDPVAARRTARARLYMACARARRAVLCIETAEYGDVSRLFGELGATAYSRKRRIRVVGLKGLPPRPSAKIPHGQLFDYRVCPKRYRLRYTLGFEAPVEAGTAALAERASTVRKAIDRFHQLRIESGEVPNARLPEIFSGSLPPWMKRQDESVRELGKQFARYGADALSKRAVIDYGREVVIPIGGDLVSGRIDAVQRSLANEEPRPAIVEVKFTETPLAREKALFQLSLYRLAYRAPSVDLEIYFLDEGKRVSLRAPDMDRFRAEVTKLLEGIRRGEFEPRPERAKCLECPMSPLCPEGQKASRAKAPAQHSVSSFR